ncbi:MAG TPA: endonuclease III [Chloroflexota bacterium]|nr:endonuclease III [Chloroflexota bacterium]HZU07995.1 endonuclease III [Chloroflexota bacterium]
MVARRAPPAAAPPDGQHAATSDDARSALAREIDARLSAYYGEPPPPRGRDEPLDELIEVVLSQHTSDINADRAYAALRARFPTWEAVRRAPTPAVAEAIRSGGLATIKATRIQRILNQILAARGELSLRFLRTLPLAEARAFLRQLDGVGPKTAACVLLFGLQQPAMPVDTHVHRVARRLGLIDQRTSAEAAHEQLERLVPPEAVYRFHVNLIRHGRQLCRAQRPHCARCPVQALCAYPAKTPAGASGPTG